jgi:hypothetical protein
VSVGARRGTSGFVEDADVLAGGRAVLARASDDRQKERATPGHGRRVALARLAEPPDVRAGIRAGVPRTVEGEQKSLPATGESAPLAGSRDRIATLDVVVRLVT